MKRKTQNQGCDFYLFLQKQIWKLILHETLNLEPMIINLSSEFQFMCSFVKDFFKWINLIR
jgi:cytoplasmic iron level regulating protein YaaA (DUF328/UPF0246 family)